MVFFHLRHQLASLRIDSDKDEGQKLPDSPLPANQNFLTKNRQGFEIGKAML